MLVNKVLTTLYKIRSYPIQFAKNLIHLHLPELIFRRIYKRFEGKSFFLPYPPKYVTIAINGYCMNACLFCSSHCIDSGRNELSNHQFNIPFTMTYEEFCRIVDMCYSGKVPHVHIVAAGEPFLHKDIFKMMDYIGSKYLNITVQTNFSKSIFSNEVVIQKLLQRKNLITRITSDIFPPDVHNEIKKGSDYNFILDTLEHISKNSNIFFDIHTILTKNSYKGIDKLIIDLYRRKINFSLSIVNLHTHNFNEFTSPKNTYLSENNEIHEELKKAKRIAEKLKVKVNIPLPWDQGWKLKDGKCLTFWSRFQVVPDKKISKEKWIGNVIPSQCNAVVIGNLSSLGNLFDNENIMDFWNNESFVKIRRNLIMGRYPDKMCETCYISDKSKFIGS